WLVLSSVPFLHGYASGKSSIGRLDVLVRLIADYASGYDEVLPAIRTGEDEIKLYAEITPISFPIIIKAGISLNQIRFFSGDAPQSELTPEILKLYPDLLLNSTVSALGGTLSELTVDLTPVKTGPTAGLVGFRARDDVQTPIDLSGDLGNLDPAFFFEPITLQSQNETLEIVPERFYILRSRERFRLPPDVAVFVQAMSERLGELRIHYAGFVHPGFGYFRPEGTPLIFETRGHNLTTFLRHGERMAVIRYFRMSEPVDEECIRKESYHLQELTLSRHFREWGNRE
ncbi:MAG: 2'-deoxycytidine 5'-triphosphate deaminase domain-containing protein, partial [bacterium]